MTPVPQAYLRPARILGLVTPLVVAAVVVVLLLLPNILMHTGLRSNTSSAPLLGGDAGSQSATAAQSPPVMR